jgi:hypothetical protein
LVPGYWESISSDSPKDQINTSSDDVAKLQNLLNANHNIRSTESLRNELLDKFARLVAEKINRYNPEEQ